MGLRITRLARQIFTTSLTDIFYVVDTLKSKYGATDVSVQLLSGVDHRLSRADDIAVIYT